MNINEAFHVLTGREPPMDRGQCIIETLDDLEKAVAYRVDIALDALILARQFPNLYRDAKARDVLCLEIGKLAVKALIESENEANMPAEAAALWGAK